MDIKAINNVGIHDLMNLCVDLDVYTQRSIYGSWMFFSHQNAIKEAIRALPELPVESSGVDGFSEYENAVRKAVVDIQTVDGDWASVLPAWLALSQHVSFMMRDVGGTPLPMSNVLEFLNNRAPTKEMFDAEFAARIKAGMRPGINRQAFIEHEYERAMARYNEQVAKGEHAIKLCESLNIKESRGYGDLPEWATETMQDKMTTKLRDRWFRAEMDRTNPRLTSKRRDEAEGNQYIIEDVLNQLGDPIERAEAE